MENKMMMPASYNVLSNEEMTYSLVLARLCYPDRHWQVP